MVTAIVLSGGSGKRMGGDRPKQYLLINGRPALAYTLTAFQNSAADEIILVTAEGYIDYCRDLIEKYNITKCTKVVAGGAERYASVYEGLKACENCDYVLIHDGARVCIDTETIDRAIEEVRRLHACVVGVKAVDTMQIVDAGGRIVDTPDRKTLWTAQTPQCFEYDICYSSYRKAIEAGDDTVTDDAMVVRKYGGIPVYMIEGKSTNIKLTRPTDLTLIEAILAGE